MKLKRHRGIFNCAACNESITGWLSRLSLASSPQLNYSTGHGTFFEPLPIIPKGYYALSADLPWSRIEAKAASFDSMIFCRDDLLLEDIATDEGELHQQVCKGRSGPNLSCSCGRASGTWVSDLYQVSYVQIPLSHLHYRRHTTSFNDPWPKQQAEISFSGSDAGYRILIVDGDPRRRAQRRQFLEAFGYIISEAERGGDGIKSAVSDRPELVLMNYELPDMTGLQATALIRRQVIYQHIALLDSASDEGDRWLEALRGRCNDYLQEPCFKLELLELVKRFALLAGERRGENGWP